MAQHSPPSIARWALNRQFMHLGKTHDGIHCRTPAVVGSPHCLEDAADMAPRLSDWRGRYRGRALAVVRPRDAGAGGTVRLPACPRAFLIVPQGNTGSCGGATPLMDGRCIVSTCRALRQVREVDQANNTLTIEAGPPC